MRYIKDYWLVAVLFIGSVVWFGWLTSWWAAVPVALLIWVGALGIALWATSGTWRP